MSKRYTEYVDSGVPWIGDVPADWTTRPLWSMFERIKDVGHPDEQMLSVFRDYGVVAKDSRDNINKTAENRNIYQLVHPGWLVTNRMKAWQGSVGISGLRGIVSGHYICFAPRHDADSRYLNWLFRSPTYAAGYALQSRGVRIGQAEIDNDLYRVMPVLLPPIEEQRAIADHLDRETARIDTLIEEQQVLIEMLRERRQAVIEHATATGGSTPPSEWRVAILRRIGRFITGTTPTGDPEDVFDTDGQLGWARPEDLGGRVAPSRRLSALGAAQVRPARDAVLVCCIGATVGKVGWADGLVSSNQQITAIEIEGAAQYWYYALTGSRSALVALAVGNTIPILNNMRLGELEVAVPPISEQHKIAVYLDEETGKIDALIAETERFIELARERRAALITAAVTGQIDVREMA